MLTRGESSGFGDVSDEGGVKPASIRAAFGSLSEAEHTLQALESWRRECLRSGDSPGLRQCRDTGLLVRRRAEMISRNPRVRPGKRAVKAEIAHWFQVWLETPELALDWLGLRKSAPAYRSLVEFEREVEREK